MQLTPVEARVLGALIEKEITTPEYYPLSLNALVAACNQKSSRDPVMTLTEDDVRSALSSLDDANLVRTDHGSRVPRFEHLARTVFQLRRDETAVFCLLLLRGPQTVGELRGRSDRMFQFEDLAAVSSTLQRMSIPAENRAEPLVRPTPRQSGRYEHTLFEGTEVQTFGTFTPNSATKSALEERVARLEHQVEELKAIVEGIAR